MRREIGGHSRSEPASTPPETRIYAVGDIHGRSDLLAETIARIDDDLRRRPIRHSVEVYLGDYIDRGPDSKGVIDQLAVRLVRRHAICLRGNHEQLLEIFLHDPEAIRQWAHVGAMQTLASYGVSINPNHTPLTTVSLQHALREVFPRTHELFLQCLRNSFSCGDFLFVHAGIRPGVPMEQQDTEDLLWIRDEFLDSTYNHGKIVIHGHTPVEHTDFRDNRINIDTGAWRSGVLTTIAIENADIMVL
ncbi:metallophosphoesterase [Afipia sp. Root123D2]|uniref:metallophosphoesterase family protein n=1 Tax=Afipia sp. Root123D2 TaxID=1736436 RepID=UPI0006FFEB95|nr:metallophosphoesterase family protein [Afipia sp. Root123D2]KQW18337.1 metallophosphoesterase [Afipia sp. Root123D2]